MKPERPGRGITIYGSEGVMELSRNFYKLYDLGGNLLKQEDEANISATLNTQGIGGLDVDHVGNFFNAIRKDTSLNSDIRDASVSTMLCHLGNLAYDAGHTIEIDTQTGKILNSEKAMQGWKREYENGWDPKL